jgi:hypothetical protein
MMHNNDSQSPVTTPANAASLLDPDAEARESHSLGRIVVPLMKGVMYRDADAARWSSLLALQSRVREHVAVLGLELVLDEAEGYAFLKSGSRAEADDTPDIPRLIARRPLSFPVSLLIALLRKRLVEFDATGGATRLVLSRDDLVELLRLFMPDTSNEARLIDQVDAHINKVIDLGFLRKLKSGTATGSTDTANFEVMRIIKAFVDAQWLSAFSEHLSAYANSLSAETDAADTKAKPPA